MKTSNLGHLEEVILGERGETSLENGSDKIRMLPDGRRSLKGNRLLDSGSKEPNSFQTSIRPEFPGHHLLIQWPNGDGSSDYVRFFYESDKMARIVESIRHVADTDVTVFIQGESGVGKELVARALHYRSARETKPFIKVNCAALPEALLESELFGYEKGAFTGAYNRKPGRFELAHGGTIFLDEIADISLSLQAKLLQVLQDGEFARLGGRRDIQVDVRVLVATNKNLEEHVRTGRFREDLYYRVNVLNIRVPPLRERREEIPILIQYFLDKNSRKYGNSVPPLSRDVSDLLLTHDWPGNVRQLENMIKRFVLLGNEEVIKEELNQRHSPKPQQPHESESQDLDGDSPKVISLKEISRKASLQAERQVILRALQQTRWNRKKAANLLGISYKALLYKIKKCGLDLD